MAQGGRNDPTQNSDSEVKLLVGCVVVVGIVFFMWWFGRGWIVRLGLALSWPKLWATKLTLGLTENGNDALRYATNTLMNRVDAWNVPVSDLWVIMSGAGSKFMWIYMAAILAMAVWCMFKMKGNGFTSKHDMNSLAEKQALSWRTLTPGAVFKPDTAPMEWDQARRPTDWIKDNGIRLNREEGLDVEKVEEVLTTHLGDVWRGYNKGLPVHIRALITIFALHHIGKATKVDGETKPYALILREDVAVAYANMPKGPALDAHIESLIKPFANEGKMNSAIENVLDPKKHAYVNTALYSQLIKARKRRGVLGAGELLWVKGIDRTLWYVLNNAGRRAYHVEGGGAVAHFDAERVTGTALIEPHIGQARYGVETYLKDQFITDIDEFLKSETPEPWEQ